MLPFQKKCACKLENAYDTGSSESGIRENTIDKIRVDPIQFAAANECIHDSPEFDPDLTF
jgi:hypothetical protein